MDGRTAGRRTAPVESPRAERRLLAPSAMRRALPASAEAQASVAAAREDLRALLHGRDRRRLAVLVGPGSLHDPEGALDYARRLRRLAAAVSGELLVVMRCFVGRPRTGGWPGLVNDPERDGSCDLGLGLATARQTLRRIADLGIACATELQEPFVAPYLEDLVAWGLVAANGRDGPAHHPLASGVPYPVGCDCDGDAGLDAALRALRGRCDARAIAAARALAPGSAGAVLLDALHEGAPLLGVTLRSYLEEGRQEIRSGRRLRYGVAVGAACLGWSATADLLLEIAEAVKRSR